MYSLLLDSSNTNLSVGISKDNQLIYQNSFSCWQRQAELMIPEIEKALNETSLSLKDIDEVVCAKGPGSYTGVRIALTIAKILSQMNKSKLVLISSLRIMGTNKQDYIALMNARSARSYVGVYSKNQVIVEDTIMTNDEVKELIAKYPSYEVIGETGYLGIEGNKPNEIQGLLSLKDIVEEESDILKVKPVYLKDNYGI